MHGLDLLNRKQPLECLVYLTHPEGLPFELTQVDLTGCNRPENLLDRLRGGWFLLDEKWVQFCLRSIALLSAGSRLRGAYLLCGLTDDVNRVRPCCFVQLAPQGADLLR